MLRPLQLYEQNVFYTVFSPQSRLRMIKHCNLLLLLYHNCNFGVNNVCSLLV
jgi:hypothetical protein